MGCTSSYQATLDRYIRITGCTEDQAEQIHEVMTDVIPNFPDMDEVRRMSYAEQVKIAYQAVVD